MKTIQSVILKSQKEFEMVYLELINVFKNCQISLKRLNIDKCKENYYYVKSHRSNVTEGNTTTVGEFTEIVRAQLNQDVNFTISGKPHDEVYEIVNLKKCYEFLHDSFEYSSWTLQRSHSILGDNIFKNNLVENRGRLKSQNNYVPFSLYRCKYCKYFCDYKQVKASLNRLFKLWNGLDDSCEASVFAKFVIIQIELISIHPFQDGNGRVARAMSESFLEKHGYVPYTPYSTMHKRSYQDAMNEYSVTSLESVVDAYKQFASFILMSYESNTCDLLTSVERIIGVTEVK